MMYCFAKFCRLCLQKGDELLDYKTKDDDNISLINKINTLMPSLIISNQNYPTLICYKCRIQLNNSYKFFKDCFKNNQQLVKYNYQLNFNGDKINCELNVILHKLEEPQHNIIDIITIDDDEGPTLNQKDDDGSTLSQKDDESLLKPETSNFDETTNINKTKNVCTVCGRSFSQFVNMKRHFESMHLKIKHTCRICYKSFTQAESLRFHERVIHLDIREHNCEYCGRRFAAPRFLRNHLKICKFRIEITAGLKADEGLTLNQKGDENPSKHKTTNTEQKKHVCKVCNKSFSQLRYMKTHFNNVHMKISVHSNIRKHKCEYCGHRFAMPKFLKKHLKVCKNRKKIWSNDGEGSLEQDQIKEPQTKREKCVCKICGKLFSYTKSLKYHLKNIHHKYNCEICNKSLEDCNETCKCLKKINDEGNTKINNVLIETERNDSDPNNFNETTLNLKKNMKVCETCGKSFSNNTKLKRHIDSVHLKIRHKCQNCDRSFSEINKLNLHKKIVHLKFHTCNYCGCTFPNIRELMQHLEMCKDRKETTLNDDEGPSLTADTNNEINTLNKEAREKPEEIIKFELKTEEIDIE